MLVGKGVQYIPASFDDEAAIERVVQDQAELLFGSASIYLPKARIATADCLLKILTRFRSAVARS
jgi:hypothetical protein